MPPVPCDGGLYLYGKEDAEERVTEAFRLPRPPRTMSKQQQPPESMSMTLLRIWLWIVPIGLLAGAVVFGVIAALEGSWALFGVMIVIGLFALGLMMLHWWAMYRFGRDGGSGGYGS